MKEVDNLDSLKVKQFLTWLKEREQRTKEEFKAKGWTEVKCEVTVIKEKFEEVFGK